MGRAFWKHLTAEQAAHVRKEKATTEARFKLLRYRQRQVGDCWECRSIELTLREARGEA